MVSVGQRERKVQARVVKLLTDKSGLAYEYLGNWQDRAGNSNVEEALLRAFLERQGYESALITKTLAEVNRVVSDQSLSLYDLNKEFYGLLRYGVKVRPEIGEHKETVELIDWENPENNHFAIAEEVTVVGKNNKRPDIVLYVNGMALGVLELKRSTVGVTEGIRQNIDSQKADFVRRFFSTIQLAMAGNDTQGLWYGVIETPEKYWLNWKEKAASAAVVEIGAAEEVAEDETPYPNVVDVHPAAMSLLDEHLSCLCRKERFLELIHDFIVFDAGIKKVCRHNQYFGVKAAQERVRRRQGGIIWHTQGSGKSLTMVWLAKWIRENVQDSRVLIITDRTELDEQIEKVFLGVNEHIYRTTSGADLITQLGQHKPWLLCSLIHKFGIGRREDEPDVDGFVDEVKKAIPLDFNAKGDIFIFVDEAHRTQSGLLHDAMKEIVPGAMFIGFTGTPIFSKDKKKTYEIFGPPIHTYKFDEAVADGVVLDLRYEARDIDQSITSQGKIDQWFNAKTSGLNDIAKAQLKQRWGTMQKVLSSQSRLEKIVADILMDMETRDRLKSAKGNAMLVTSSIYEACKCYELFEKAGLAGKCAIVTSYKPSPADIKGEDAGEGLTERLRQYEIYRKMLATWFNEPEDKAMYKVEAFEKAVKKKFIKEPGQMKLLIVVDKLLTGFDAPPATYLYIDKNMADHGLFQAVCRVNRLDSTDKEYGYIIDYKDLFRSLEESISDYTSEAFEKFDREDVEGLLKDRLKEARERLEEVREAIHALCEPVEQPRDAAAYQRFFLTPHEADDDAAKEFEKRRLTLYRMTAAYLRAYANLANEMKEAGYSDAEMQNIKADVEHFEAVRNEIKLASGDYIDLKMYEPAMRHLIDTYIRAEESEKVSAFDDFSLVQLVVEKGEDAVNDLPKGIRDSEDAVAETIEGNVRRLIIDESPINPKYYEQMSELLDALIKERKAQAISYKEYLEKIVELTRKAKAPERGGAYPGRIVTPGMRSLYDNLDKNEELAVAIDRAVKTNKQDDWQSNTFKTRLVRNAILGAVGDDEELADQAMAIVREQQEYL